MAMLIDAVKMVLDLCGTGTNRNRFIACHNMMTLDDLEHWDPGDVTTIVKMHNEFYRQVTHQLGFTSLKEGTGM